jgi:hypothetical protein
MNHREPEQQVDCAVAQTHCGESHILKADSPANSLYLRMHHITGRDSVVSVTWLLML